MKNKIHNTNERAVEEIADTLRIEMPGKKLPLAPRLIAVFTLIGGLSIIGSLFVDIGRPSATIRAEFYLLRLVIGIVAVSTAYGIIKKQSWAIWLYGLLSLVALYLNPITFLVPAAVFVYLYLHRKEYEPFFLDIIIARFLIRLKK